MLRVRGSCYQSEYATDICQTPSCTHQIGDDHHWLRPVPCGRHKDCVNHAMCTGLSEIVYYLNAYRR